MRNSTLLYLFVVLSLIHLWAEQQAMEWLILSTKPLLVSMLAIWFWQTTKKEVSGFRRFLFWGLVFSIGGDTLLMFVEHGPQLEVFFLLGLGSFLIAQLCYAYALWAFPAFSKGVIYQKPWLILLFIIYLVWILNTLWTGIPAPMRGPVSVYAIAIVSMAIAAANLYGRVASSLFWAFFAGVLLFVLSDTLIAFNKFGAPVSYARFLIMFTYLLGQMLIAVYGSRLAKTIEP